ncbi:hypothetical protein [Peptoniphilus vaginalis]|uniref:hypothetical protein n=1 Tax=Peptoniphilus vaginalis TaxID=1756987 RepID=UPI0023F7E359|nr:hypothetical protein [Peptoniphilus vaginalis]
MEKNYLKFLVSELIFVREDTLINLIPKTEKKYREIFGDLENYVDTLNLNIRKLRRNLKLLDKLSPDLAKKKAEEEFERDFEELREDENFDSQSRDLDEDKLREIEDLFRQAIFYYSPKLNDFSIEEFDQAREAFRKADKEGLEEFLKKDKPRELEMTNEQLEIMREDLEIETSILFERFPLNQLDMLEDKEAIDFNLNRLKNVYEEYQEIYGSLGEELNIKIAKKETTS